MFGVATGLPRHPGTWAKRRADRPSQWHAGADCSTSRPTQGTLHAARIAGEPIQDPGAADAGRASRDRLDRCACRQRRGRYRSPVEFEPGMTRIALVVSDVDGTLLTKDKTLTEASKEAVRKLRTAGIAFTITSSRP